MILINVREKKPKRQVVPIGMPTVCWENTSTKHSKYCAIQRLEHVDDFSFREVFGRIRVAFYKIRSAPS